MRKNTILLLVCFFSLCRISLSAQEVSEDANKAADDLTPHTFTYIQKSTGKAIRVSALVNLDSLGRITGINFHPSDSVKTLLPEPFRYSYHKRPGNVLIWRLGQHQGEFCRLAGPALKGEIHFCGIPGKETAPRQIPGSELFYRNVISQTADGKERLFMELLPGIGFTYIEISAPKNRKVFELKEVDGISIDSLISIPGQARPVFFP